MNIKKYEEKYLNEDIVIGGVMLAITIVKMIVMFSIICKYWKVAGIGSARNDYEYSRKLYDIVKEECVVKEYRDRSPNACVYPNGIIYYSTAIKELFTEEELIAVLLHEYGHKKENHSKQRLIRTEGYGLAFEIGISLLALIAAPALGAFLAIAYLLLPNSVRTYVSKKVVRRTELEADSYAKKFGYAPHLASGLKKLEDYIKEHIRKYWNIKDEKKVQEEVDKMQRSAGYPTFKERIEKVLSFAAIRKIVQIGNLSSLSMIEKIVTASGLFKEKK